MTKHKGILHCITYQVKPTHILLHNKGSPSESRDFYTYYECFFPKSLNDCRVTNQLAQSCNSPDGLYEALTLPIDLPKEQWMVAIITCKVFASSLHMAATV